jgi:hypothetical protein
MIGDIAIVFSACLPVLIMAAWLVLPDLMGERLARALTPPLYPGMRLIDTRLNVIDSTVEETRLYLSNDDVFAVGGWMTQRMPGFDMCPGNIQASCWANQRCDRSPMTNMLLRALWFTESEDRRPCASVVLRSDAYGSTRTVMEVKLVWPKS